jgi:hypothetical protein
MATRSRIGITNPDGTVTSIYCHNDGYPEHNGKILAESYQDPEKVKALIALGNISSLDESIECPEGHSFDNRIAGHTVAYHRDRKEKFSQQTNKSVDSFMKSDLERYGYLFTQQGEWICIDGDSREVLHYHTINL